MTLAKQRAIWHDRRGAAGNTKSQLTLSHHWYHLVQQCNYSRDAQLDLNILRRCQGLFFRSIVVPRTPFGDRVITVSYFLIRRRPSRGFPHCVAGCTESHHYVLDTKSILTKTLHTWTLFNQTTQDVVWNRP